MSGVAWEGLGPRLEAMVAELDVETRLASDPVSFPRRYGSAADQEVAALLASTVSYGRVAGIWATLEVVFDLADASGGPRSWVEDFDVAVDGPKIFPLVHRWTRGRDLVLFLLALRRVLDGGDSVGAHLQARRPGELSGGLASLVDRFRAAAVAEARSLGLGATSFEELPRGTRYLLPSPRKGSACKRWNMALRWLVREASDGIDLGLWTHVSPGALVIPLDTHVHRISRFIGLTNRRDAGWRTAEEVTTSLRELDPLDPVRFDFPLAHLGISGACLGRREATVCPSCPLHPLCRAP